MFFDHLVTNVSPSYEFIVRAATQHIFLTTNTDSKLPTANNSTISIICATKKFRQSIQMRSLGDGLAFLCSGTTYYVIYVFITFCWACSLGGQRKNSLICCDKLVTKNKISKITCTKFYSTCTKFYSTVFNPVIYVQYVNQYILHDKNL